MDAPPLEDFNRFSGRSDFDPKDEAEHAAHIFQDELKDHLDKYTDARLEGIGGSGLVFSALYEPHSSRRALKVPRKRSYKATTPDDSPPEVDPELDALSKLSHANITRLYESFQLVKGKGHCMITEFVEDAKPLHEFAYTLCCAEDCLHDDSILDENLHQLASTVYDLVCAITYMHETAHLIHFDIKPDNLLVSREGRAFVVDLGFARDMTQYKGTDKVKIGFTYKYATRKIRDPHFGGRVSQTAAKSKNVILGSELDPVIDLFALGRSIQEVLRKIEFEYGERIHSFYFYNYLHVVACLCLAGRNGSSTHIDDKSEFVSDRALGMPSALFRARRFYDMQSVKHVLERLLGLNRLEHEVPELDRWGRKTIRISGLGMTTLTPRVEAILNHPTFNRLRNEKQLGMLDTIFPTATHNRFQHSLGVYHAVCEYLLALFYDPENPTFRIFVREKEARRAILAALVHDLGQSTFGHELEEIDEDEFGHAKIGKMLMESISHRDGEGRTLSNIMEGNGTDCWDVNVDEIVTLFNTKQDDPMDRLINDILDGQLDADKFDYLVRDSKECRVSYGDGIDRERFLRSLTTSVELNEENPGIRLSIKGKGAASAEAISLARYQLYQSLYWHHTFRATKSMLLTAATELFEELRQSMPKDSSENHPFRVLFGEFVLGLKTEADRTMSEKTTKKMEEIRQLLASTVEPDVIGPYRENKTLLFLWKLSSNRASRLFEDLMARRYYKRVLEIPIGALSENDQLKLRDRFKSNRLSLQNNVEDRMRDTLETAIQGAMEERDTMRQDKVLDRMQKIFSERYGFTIDLPLRGWVASGDDPKFVSDYARRYFREGVGGEKNTRTATLWSKHLPGMMRRVAFFRVYCEPDLHNILTRVWKSKHVLSALSEALPGIRLREVDS